MPGINPEPAMVAAGTSSYAAGVGHVDLDGPAPRSHLVAMQRNDATHTPTTATSSRLLALNPLGLIPDRPRVGAGSRGVMLRTRTHGSSRRGRHGDAAGQVRLAACFGALRGHRRRIGQAAVRAGLVIVLDVASQGATHCRHPGDHQPRWRSTSPPSTPSPIQTAAPPPSTCRPLMPIRPHSPGPGRRHPHDPSGRVSPWGGGDCVNDGSSWR
jgi:hypothetical protein